MPDPLTIYINFALALLRRDRQRDRVMLEIKGLGAAVTEARKGIADARAASAGVGESARRLVSVLGDVKEQLDNAHDDLKFEAQTLGNSQASDEKLTAQSQNGAGNGAGDAVVIPDGAVNHLDRNGVNKAASGA